MGSLNLSSHQVLAMQALNEGQQHGANQLIAVGSDLYYVIRAQIGSAPTNALRIYKSSNKTTWALAATLAITPQPSANTESHDCPCCLVGTVIYILGAIINSSGSPATAKLVLHRFDTVAGTFLADGALGPNQAAGDNSGAVDQTYSVSPFNNAKLLVSSQRSRNPVVGAAFELQTYDTVGDAWSAATTVSLDSSSPLQQIHDPVSDLAFVFYQVGTTNALRCLTVTAALAYTDAAVVTFPITQPSAMGLPVITTNTNEVVLPFRFLPASGPPVLKVARAVIQTTPVFSVDLVEDCSTLPALSQIQAWDQIAGPGWMAMDISGRLYVFYDIDNGEVDNSTSRSWLYYRSSTGAGVWSAPAIAYTSVVPGEQLIPYGSRVPGFSPVILLGVIDPTLWPAIASLTNFILYPDTCQQLNWFR